MKGFVDSVNPCFYFMRSTKIISEGLPGKAYSIQPPASPATESDKPKLQAPPKLPKERPAATDFFTTIVYFFALIALLSQLALLLVFDF